MDVSFSISGTSAERAALVRMVFEDDTIYAGAQEAFKQIEFLSRNNKEICWASNAYLAKYLNKSIRSVSRYISQLVKAGYICINLIYKNGRVNKRILAINISKLKERIANKCKTSAEFFNRNVKVTTREFFRFINNGFANDNVYTCGVDKRYKDTKEKKDILYKYNISKKEKSCCKSRPDNYDDVLQLWIDKNLAGTAKAFWKYNTTRKWTNIHNWKHAAIGWAKKAAKNLAAFRANKTKHTEPCTTDYVSALPDVSYNRWDLIF